MPKPDSNTWRNADRLAKGRLETILLGESDAGVSLHRISLALNREYGITVVPQTLDRWIKEIRAEIAADFATEGAEQAP